MIETREIRLKASGVRSLVWENGTLVDWAAGGQRYALDGSTMSSAVYFSDIFDAATISPSGEYVVIYARLGTKGLILRDGKHVREINRSYYQADAYEYPLKLLRLPNGREAIVHCPEEYNRLEIEDLESGERLTGHGVRELTDFFHSRLDSSPDGNLLVSAGWIWHPIDEVRAYSIEAILRDSSILDGDGIAMDTQAEESSASFLADSRLVVALNDEGCELKELRIFDLQHGAKPCAVPLGKPAGTVMAIGNGHILALLEYPRLIALVDGREVQTWEHIRSGKQNSSILVGTESLPPMAFDRAGQRLAVADATGITVLEFQESKLGS